MTDDNPTPPQSTYQHDRDLLRRGVKIDDAIRGITDDDRKMIINKSLRKANSALSVSWQYPPVPETALRASSPLRSMRQ
jgi:hypothetical protein